MSSGLIFYPVLSEKLLGSIGFTSEILQFSYTENYEEFPLKLDSSSDNFKKFSAKLNDSRCIWHPETHDLIIRKEYKILSAYTLFGSGGIAASTSELGIALRWISSKSDERGVIPFGSISKYDYAREYKLDYRFEKGKLKGSLILQTVIYLKKCGNCQNDEAYFARQQGTILGILDQAEVYIDGNGSVFPIVTVNAPGKTLWNVYYNDACDPLHDSFDEENVEIRLNRAHPAFDTLKIDSSLSESTMFLEVISSALFIIVASAKESLGEDWNMVMNGEGFDSGSIAAAMNHFVNKLQWDISSPSKLAESIKNFFEKHDTGGVK